MSKIELSKVDVDSKQELTKLHQVIANSYDKVPSPITPEDLKHPDKTFFWAKQGDQLIGCSGIYQKTQFLVETIKTVILDEFRGSGLGVSLSQAIEDECKKMGFKKIMSTIYTSNHQMIAIKIKQGYVIEGHHKDHEAPGWDEYSLGKILR